MKWPTGRYNGKRIVGIEFKIVLDITTWRWVPIVGHCVGMFHWLCFRSWTNPAYESHWKAEKRASLQEKAKQLGIKRHDTYVPNGPFEED